MMPFLKKLHIRIMVPFLVLFFLVSVISLMLNRYYMSSLMDERVSRQTDRLSHMLSNSEFIFNPSYLYKLRQVIEGDIIVYEHTGKVVVSTFKNSPLSIFNPKINVTQISSLLQAGQQKVALEIRKNETPFLLISRKLTVPTRPDKKMILCIISPLSDVISAKSQITIQLLLVGLCALAVAVLFGYVISRSVTRPVNNLVTITEDIAKGKFEKKAFLPSIDELEKLAASVNTMSDKLRDYEKQIVRSSQMAAAGKVSSAMAHEIRNPLSSIKMMTQLLRDRLGTESENKKVVESLLEEISRIERIVKDLTHLMRPSDFCFALNDVNDVIEEIIPVVLPKLKHRNILLEKSLTRTLPKVNIDKDKIKQVIWNLLLNAMDSMPQGGTIRIMSYHNTGQGSPEVAIQDQGVGILEEAPDRIFAPFYSTKPEGLGLGLSISRQIVEEHGGSLSVENRKTRGVRVTILLPLPA